MSKIQSEIILNQVALEENNAVVGDKDFISADNVALDADGEKSSVKLGPILFLIFVVIPTIIVLTYSTFFASEQYVSESRFVVRSLGEVSQSVTGDGKTKKSFSILKSSSTTQDAHIVMSFINSIEILKRLEETIDLDQMFGSDNIDFFSRMGADLSMEKKLKYWSKQVTTYIDGPSGIVTLTVLAFDPEDSLKISHEVLKASEALIDELSERARTDVLARARLEVDQNKQKYLDVLSSLAAYQDKVAILNPESVAEATLALRTELTTRQLALDTRLFILEKSNAAGGGNYKQLKQQRDNLQAQIEQFSDELAGDNVDTASLSKNLVEFTRLQTDKLLAENIYSASRSAAVFAQNESVRKSTYIGIFSSPRLPVKSEYPKPLQTTFITFLICFLIWATALLLWASIEDHRY